jgi:hypothetical protein
MSEFKVGDIVVGSESNLIFHPSTRMVVWKTKAATADREQFIWVTYPGSNPATRSDVEKSGYFASRFRLASEPSPMTNEDKLKIAKRVIMNTALRMDGWIVRCRHCEKSGKEISGTVQDGFNTIEHEPDCPVITVCDGMRLS